jgi:hypothetical protein
VKSRGLAIRKIGIGLLLLSLCGCGKASIAALSHEQDAYYAKLSSTLERQGELFDSAIEAQLQADESRRRQILEWNRSLSNTDVLLQSGKTRGREGLLLRNTAELDIASQQDFLKLSEAERARGQALKNLYGALIDATLAAQKNNTQITDYLTSGNTTFALQSLDAGGVSLAVSTVQARLDQLKGATEKTADQRKADQEKLQKQIDETRNVLVKVLEAQNGKH